MGVGGCCNLERPPQHLHTAHRPDVDKVTAFNYKVKERLLERRRNSILLSYRVYGLLLINAKNEVSHPANLRAVASDFGWVSQVART